MQSRGALQTELHRHLDVSVRVPTLYRLAQERGLVAQSTSLEAFRAKHVMSRPLSSLSEVLGEFALYQHVLDRPDVLADVAFEVVEDCRAEGTRRVELRFSPSFVTELSHLPFADTLDGFEAGVRRALEKYPEMQVGLICIGSREYGPDAVAKTVEFFLKNRERFIGLDLAGDEKAYPCRTFRAAFLKAKDEGAHITVHAGEGGGPENIWEAIEELGAERIGHGIDCVKDPALMQYLAEKRICLEICPTSNWLTQVAHTIAEHPLPRIVRAGVPASINTDDPGIFGVTLPHEFQISREQMGLSEGEIESCLASAARYSFLPEYSRR